MFDPEATKELMAEANILCSLHHPNIVRCWGCDIRVGTTGFRVNEWLQIHLHPRLCVCASGKEQNSVEVNTTSGRILGFFFLWPHLTLSPQPNH